MTRPPLSPQDVRALTDVELSAHVATACGIRVFVEGAPGRECFEIVGKQTPLHPDCGEAVVYVIEHMRRLWFDSEPDPFVRLHWSMYTALRGWIVEAERTADDEGDPAYSASSERLGRAVFECALLAAQEDPYV